MTVLSERRITDASQTETGLQWPLRSPCSHDWGPNFGRYGAFWAARQLRPIPIPVPRCFRRAPVVPDA